MQRNLPPELWKSHCHLYPLLAYLARIVLVVPGSQIECERVLSLAGLLTNALRNRMFADRLNSVVLVSKNIDMYATLTNLLGSYYEHGLFRSVKDDFRARSEIDLAKDLIDDDNNVID